MCLCALEQKIVTVTLLVVKLPVDTELGAASLAFQLPSLLLFQLELVRIPLSFRVKSDLACLEGRVFISMRCDG